ncbi:cupin domain-containing protein [Effusibacillus dendaii]|uniref:Cupin type-2 domain-containing protein n=1 Tax=Effusibacillus dendaii TaxID=2743772 RepID=A0A7I8D9W6_9BACL|nr:cupin domain-containing protein [Effusibacillus dendaii]BCJ86963.1 hypothetical protein skT53_19480 [Effusibacillus dendaii]
MENLNIEVKRGKHYTLAEAGNWSDLDQYTYGPKQFPGKLFLKDVLELTGMEVSMNKLPAGKKVPFYHAHKENEELYIFVKGQGQFQVDDEVMDVREGTVIRVSTPGVRTWRNNSQEDLYFIVIQAKENSLTQCTVEDGIVPDRKVEWPD